MAKKISVDQTMQDIVYLKNQIDGLNMLLTQKKEIMAAYFEKSGNKSVSNDECTVFTTEKCKVDYDVDAICKRLEKSITEQFIDRTVEIKDMKGLGRVLKKAVLSFSDIRPFLFISKKVNESKLSKLYDKELISLEDLKGCYSSSVTKSVVLRMKNIDSQINIGNSNEK